VIYVFGILWVSFFKEGVPQLKQLSKQRDMWALKVSMRRAENARLREQIAKLGHDFRYVEKILREDLLLHKPGELIILVPEK